MKLAAPGHALGRVDQRFPAGQLVREDELGLVPQRGVLLQPLLCGIRSMAWCAILHVNPALGLTFRK